MRVGWRRAATVPHTGFESSAGGGRAPAGDAAGAAAGASPVIEATNPPVEEEPVPEIVANGETSYAVTGMALSLRGTPYVNGGTTPSGFDCSGLVQYVFARHGVALPREARDQFRMGRKIKDDDIQPGDLVFFHTTTRGASHVGIALGGTQFVHAPSESGVVRVESLDASYWARRYLGARRVAE